MATNALLVSGPVNFLQIGSAAAVAEVADGPDGVRTKVQLWADAAAVIPNPETQISWVSLCQEALRHGNDVQVFLENANSAQVGWIQLLPAPSPRLSDD